MLVAFYTGPDSLVMDIGMISPEVPYIRTTDLGSGGLMFDADVMRFWFEGSSAATNESFVVIILALIIFTK